MNMRKKEILKRRKYTTNTYMKEAIDYDITIIKEDDVFYTVKKYKKMTSNVHFQVEDVKKVYIDEGYYLVEVTPLKEHYNIRYYFDREKNYIDCYIDITYENGVDHMIPYYADLYLDILHNTKTDKYMFTDENELEDAFKNKLISKKDYEMAYRVGNKILKNASKYVNKWDVKKILEWM